MRVGQVSDVYVVALLLASARNCDRLTSDRRTNEPRDDESLAHPRTVWDSVPQNREVLAVQLPVAVHEHLCGEFGRDIDVSRVAQVDRRVLGKLAASYGRAKNPYRARENEPVDTGVPCRIQDPSSALNVEPDGTYRVSSDVVHVSYASQVKHCFGTSECRSKRLLVEYVRMPVMRCWIEPALPDVKDGHIVAGRNHVVDHMRADKPASPGYCHAHGCSPTLHEQAPTSASYPGHGSVDCRYRRANLLDFFVGHVGMDWQADMPS